MAEPRRATLASRTALATVAVALVAVVITGVVSLRLVPQAAERQARQTLADQADLVAAAAEEVGQPLGAARLGRFRRLLEAQGTTLSLVGPAGRSTGDADPADVEAVLAGRSVSAVRDEGAGTVFVEARPTSAGGGVVLSQPGEVVRTPARGAARSLLVAMIVGLAVAVGVGLLLAGRLARPLRRAADAARQLAAGRRDVRLPAEGPQEVADVADALNGLGTALVTSERRQQEFLLSVSHELRTPLTAVRGYAEALADGVVPPDDVARTGATIGAEAARLERLVGDLLDLARLGADDFRLDLAEVDLTALVTAAAEVWSSRGATGQVDVRLEEPGVPVIVTTDPVRVRQILDGLADNAVRVTPPHRPVVLALRLEGDEAVLEVRDGGPGLADEDLTVAFERSALHDRYRGVRRVGTGVGLALVGGLAARLGGRALAGHAREGGAAFCVRLPLHSPNIRRADG